MHADIVPGILAKGNKNIEMRCSLRRRSDPHDTALKTKACTVLLAEADGHFGRSIRGDELRNLARKADKTDGVSCALNGLIANF